MTSADVPDQTGADPTSPTALEALVPFATVEVDVADDVSLREAYTQRGLHTVLHHRPPSSVRHAGAALVLCGGALGGLHGPGRSLYQQLGERWSARGVPVLRVGYREPNNLDLCAHDLAVGVELARDAGAERVVVAGHSFGGAVAIRAAVVMTGSVSGVVTFATQSAGCEVAPGLEGRPLLLIHGADDDVLPAQSSELVAAIAGRGEPVILPGTGHGLAGADEIILERLDVWLPSVLGLA
ncbi:MAG: alpha/beta hydrolase [Actinomycetota bacterium]